MLSAIFLGRPGLFFGKTAKVAVDGSFFGGLPGPRFWVLNSNSLLKSCKLFARTPCAFSRCFINSLDVDNFNSHVSSGQKRMRPSMTVSNFPSAPRLITPTTEDEDTVNF